MIVHETYPNTFAEVTGDLAIGENVEPWGNFAVWGDADLALRNCYRLEYPAAPAGKTLASYTVARVDGVVQIVPVWADVPPPPVPAQVSDLQFRLALTAAGLRDAAEAYVATAPQNVKDWWDRALNFRLEDPILNAAVVAINKTRADLEGLMRLAATMPGG